MQDNINNRIENGSGKGSEKSPENNTVSIRKKHMHRINSIHFVGIGGSGMNGIAEVMLNMGYEISGSDINETPITKRLESLGAKIYKGHFAENIKNTDVVVCSTAIKNDNPEVEYAHQKLIPIVGRAQMLAEIMRYRFGIAVSGTHGKTTITSILASLLADSGLDPTFVIGGILNSAGTSAKLGESEYLIAEADESDASFLHLSPMMTVVSNIDADHLETYGGDFKKLKETFIQFLQKMPFYGLAIVCIDDKEVENLLEEVGRPILSYGTTDKADVYAKNIQANGLEMNFDVVIKKTNKQFNVTLNMPGKHNVLNSLACICVALELGVSFEQIQKGISNFTGVARRFTPKGFVNLESSIKVPVFEDYGHHPKEITAVLSAAKSAFPDKKIVGVFQPHRFSRTRDLFDDFAYILSQFDKLVLTRVYAAGEEHIGDADGKSLARAIRARGMVEPIFVKDLSEITNQVKVILKGDEVVLVMGAGNIGSIASELVE